MSAVISPLAGPSAPAECRRGNWCRDDLNPDLCSCPCHRDGGLTRTVILTDKEAACISRAIELTARHGRGYTGRWAAGALSILRKLDAALPAGRSPDSVWGTHDVQEQINPDGTPDDDEDDDPDEDEDDIFHLHPAADRL
jgi:hypothetical protein